MTEEQGKIVIRGARTHNLKNIQIDLPRNKLIVITGLSGSGKSSLAFDTLYAEGQRRYVESLSAYARQFLQLMEKPDVDLIEGLSPGDRDRPESVVAQSAFDDRDRYGNLRLPASFVRSRRNTFLSEHPEKPACRPIRFANGRCRDGHAGRHAADDYGSCRRQPER